MLHLPTILLFSVSLMLAATGVFALMARLHPGRSGLRHWLFGSLSLMLGYALRLATSLHADGPPFWWAGLFFLGGNLAIWLGILRFYRLQYRLPSRWIAPAFMAIWMLAAGLPHAAQIAANQALSGLACGFAGLAIWRTRELEPPLLRVSTTAVYLLSAITLLARALVLAVEGGGEMRVDDISALGAPVSTTLLILRCFALVVLLHADRERLLRGLATTDVLTGLMNRQGFFEQASRLLDRQRTGQESCVLMLDLDFFKRINDRFGHAAGDAVLRGFAQVLRQQLRPDDCVGRLGGEEFAILLAGTSAPAAHAIAERVRLAFSAEPMRIGDQALACTVSIGIGAGGGTLEERLLEADAALYRAKASGRNRTA